MKIGSFVTRARRPVGVVVGASTFEDMSFAGDTLVSLGLRATSLHESFIFDERCER